MFCWSQFRLPSMPPCRLRSEQRPAKVLPRPAEACACEGARALAACCGQQLKRMRAASKASDLAQDRRKPLPVIRGARISERPPTRAGAAAGPRYLNVRMKAKAEHAPLRLVANDAKGRPVRKL